LRKSINVRTFSDWNDPPPGYFEMDIVAHCGKSVAGSHVHSLVLTDIASGWTEALHPRGLTQTQAARKQTAKA